jgi:hypothetical protein
VASVSHAAAQLRPPMGKASGVRKPTRERLARVGSRS